ncbi:MAG: hypothetical protein AAF533_14130 [Acidobacteriota bacterium]
MFGLRLRHLVVLLLGSLFTPSLQAASCPPTDDELVAAAAELGLEIAVGQAATLEIGDARVIEVPVAGLVSVPPRDYRRWTVFAFTRIEGPGSPVPPGDYTLRVRVRGRVELGANRARVQYLGADGVPVATVGARVDVHTLDLAPEPPFGEVVVHARTEFQPGLGAGSEPVLRATWYEHCPNGCTICHEGGDSFFDIFLD